MFASWSVFAACSGAGPGVDSTWEDPPGIVLIEPKSGDARYGTALTATFLVHGLTLDEEGMGVAEQDGRGHVHAYVDGGLYGETTETRFVFEGLKPGHHEVELRLATNKHDEPWGGVRVAVDTEDPHITVLSPADGVLTDRSSVPFLFDVSDFALDPDTAFGDPVFSQGRVEVRIDDVPMGFAIDPEVEVAGIPEGRHRVTLALVTADGAPLDAPVETTVDVEVAAGTPIVAVDRAAFLTPYNSATIPLSVDVTNAELEYFVYLDGTLVEKAKQREVVIEHVPAGRHQLEVRLSRGSQVFDDHDVLALWVPDGRPDVTFVTPRQDWKVPRDIEVEAAVEGFVLDPDIGGANVPGHGHYVVYANGEPLVESAVNPAPVTLPFGDHALTVQLVQNDGAALVPPVWSTIDVQVR